MATHHNHWLINDQDAKALGQAFANAARHFPLKATQKAIDVSALVIVCFAMEAPRVVRSVQIARAPKPPPNRGPAQVFQFVTPTNPGASTPAPAATATPTGDGAGQPPIAEGPPDLSAFGGEGPGAA